MATPELCCTRGQSAKTDPFDLKPGFVVHQFTVTGSLQGPVTVSLQIDGSDSELSMFTLNPGTPLPFTYKLRLLRPQATSVCLHVKPNDDESTSIIRVAYKSVAWQSDLDVAG